MSRQTRSNTNLTGNISDYLLEVQAQKEMTGDHGDNLANTSGVNGTGTSEGRTSTEDMDMQSLLALMARALNTISEQHRPNNTAVGVPKIDECPVKSKQATLESWMSEVLLWNESNGSGNNGKKYLKFLDSVRKSENCSELQNFVQVEFAENATFDKKQENIVVVMIEKIKSSLGQSDLEKCSEAWSKFIKIQQDAGESTKCYVSRFEQAESLLKNVQIVIPNKNDG